MPDHRHLPPSSRVALAWSFTVLVGLAISRPGAAVAGPLPPIDDSDRVVLRHNVHPLARPQLEIGRTKADYAMQRMVLSLALRPGGRQDLERLLANQHDPASPQYHRWLTPREFGARFGLGDQELRRVTGWLVRRGFAVDEVANGRAWINFSGTARQVEEAFATEMHDYKVAGTIRHANAVDPSIPRALSGLVNGVVTLHTFPRHPLHHVHHAARPVTPGRAAPDFSDGFGNNYLAPADFATIYDLNPAYGAGIDGSGQAIAIVARTDIQLADVQSFRSFFGLPANDPLFVHNGLPPGDLGGGEELEADLDTEWSGAVAPHATIELVISASTVTDGVDLSAQYIVDNDLAPVMSTSFGSCEAFMGTTELAFWDGLWSQAASQGITALVSSGDSGASGCDSAGSSFGSGLAVNGLASTPYNVCVGGTEFNDTANPSLYWSATNDPANQGSALSYIPEVAWNESGDVSGGFGLAASGGGESSVYAKPAWQSTPGVPSDGMRDVPDLSLSAAGHDGYLVVQGNGLIPVGGTSASSPSLAGVMALIVQHTSSRQGNANTVFYPMATSQYSSGGIAAFHDITSGDNSVPGVTGYSCGFGYDQATGLGSVDGAVLIANWGSGGCTPPPVPTGVTATASGQTGINLSWNASLGATSYVVYRSATSGGPYNTVGSSASASFFDTGLICNTTYYYVVTAGNGACSSGDSGQAQTATSSCQVTPASFYTTPPCRVFDTRGGTPLSSGATLFQIAGQCGIPAGAKAVSANLTIVLPLAPGFLTVYPGHAQLPLASTLDFSAGQVRANNAVLSLAGDGSGTINVYLGSTANADLLLDVNGYFQ
jgi:pseudomonalisin